MTSVVEMGSPEDIRVTDAGSIPLVHLVAGPCKAIPSESAHLDRNAARPPRCLQASFSTSCINLLAMVACQNKMPLSCTCSNSQ